MVPRHSRVVVARMIEIVADAGREEDRDIFMCELLYQTALVYDAIHHLCHTETVPEVVERVVSVVLLDAQL